MLQPQNFMFIFKGLKNFSLKKRYFTQVDFHSFLETGKDILAVMMSQIRFIIKYTAQWPDLFSVLIQPQFVIYSYNLRELTQL